MATYLGDFAAGSTVYFLWSTNAADGSSITRQSNGVIRVYKDDNTAQTLTGITDVEDFDSIVGVHSVAIDTSANAVFYSAATDFHVVLVDAIIDGVSGINAVLAEFSITNRA